MNTSTDYTRNTENTNNNRGCFYAESYIDPMYFYFIKGTPTAVQAMVRRALTAMAKATAVNSRFKTRQGLEVTSTNYTPPYLFAVEELYGYTMITLGGCSWNDEFELTADGIEGVEEFIWIHNLHSIAQLNHNDTENKILGRAADFGLGFLVD